MLFLSHTKLTKESLVTPFAQALDYIEIPYWFDRKDIACSDLIYKNIKQGIEKSHYCIAFIDLAYLKGCWTKKELTLFHQKEIDACQLLIIPIYCGISKENAYEIFPWLEGRAFEYLNSSVHYDVGEKAMIICRVMGKILMDLGVKTDISSIKHIPANPSYKPLWDLLQTVYASKYFASSDLQLSCMELCNIENILFAILKNAGIPITPICQVAHNYTTYVKEFLCAESIAIKYDCVVTLRQVVSLIASSLTMT